MFDRGLEVTTAKMALLGSPPRQCSQSVHRGDVSEKITYKLLAAFTRERWEWCPLHRDHDQVMGDHTQIVNLTALFPSASLRMNPIFQQERRGHQGPNMVLPRMALEPASKRNTFLWWLLATLLTVSQVAAQTVEAGDVVSVTVSANAYDPDISDEKGCPPDGCMPGKTRDNDLEGISRWSCKRELVEEVGGADEEECQIDYVFSAAIDIYSVSVALYEGDTRTRTMNVEVNGGQFNVITSDGTSEDFEEFVLNAEGVSSLTLVSAGLEDDDWLSIIEVRSCVRFRSRA